MAGQVIVVGGGVAGLITAKHLQTNGYRTTIIEQQETVGGRVQSREVDGFTLDRGFQVLFSAYPTLREELELDDLTLRPFVPGAILAEPGNRSSLSDPLRHPTGAIETLLNREITVGDKLRVIRLLLQLLNRDQSSFFTGDSVSIEQTLQEQGFSEQFINRFARPFYGGITLDRSLASSGDIFEYTFRVLARGSIGVPAAGIGAVTDQLAEHAREAGVTIQTGTEVTGVTADSDHATVTMGEETSQADAVVVATDAPTAATLTGRTDIPTTGNGVITQFYRAPAEAIPQERQLILNTASEMPNHIVVYSAIAPEYAPDGEALLAAVYLETDDHDSEELASISHEQLQSWYPERHIPELEVLATDRIEFAQFDQPPGIHDHLPSVDTPSGRCFLAGEYTAWSSLEGAAESGRAAAAAVQDTLQ